MSIAALFSFPNVLSLPVDVLEDFPTFLKWCLVKPFTIEWEETGQQNSSLLTAHHKSSSLMLGISL